MVSKPLVIYRSMPDPEPPPGLEYAGDILPYLRSATSALVPRGWYSVGNLGDRGVLNIVQESRGSRAFIEAEEGPGSVVVDLAVNNAGLMFGNNVSNVSQKLVVAGINFTNGGLVFQGTRDISFWYCNVDYSPWMWHQRALASAIEQGITIPTKGLYTPDGDVQDEMLLERGGLYSYPPDSGAEWGDIYDGMGVYYGSGIRADPGKVGVGANQDLRFFGCDVGPTTDDGFYAGGTFYLAIEGCKGRDMSELTWGEDSNGILPLVDAYGVDPGPVFGSEADQFHNDGIQHGTGGFRPTILDSWITKRTIFNKEVSSARSDWQLRMRRMWCGPSISPNTQGADQIDHLFEDPAFADWPLGDAMAWPTKSESVILVAFNAGQDPETMTCEITDCTHFAPPGKARVTYDGGATASNMASNLIFTNFTGPSQRGKGTQSLFTDLDEISDDPLNPANVWRDTNDFDQLTTYAGITSGTGYRPG